MTWLVPAAVVAGLLLGRFWLGPGAFDAVDRWVDGSLTLMMLVVGLDIGRNREAWRSLARRGARLLLVPALVALGSVAGALAAGVALRIPAHIAAAVGAGFGWYSLSGAILTRLVDPTTGALAFLANVGREILAIMLAVPLARRLGPLAPVAAGGATAMDTTMPVIARAGGPQAAVIGFLSGLLLTACSPPIIELLIRLGR